jgi:hypothetical protein
MSLPSIAQRAGSECESTPTLIDSVYNYRWEEITGQWVLNSITINNYTGSLLSLSRTINGFSREPISQIEYFYNSDNFNDLRVAYRWVNGVMDYLQRSVFVPGESGQNSIETYYNWYNGQWELWGRFINEYSEGKLTGYLQQLINSSGDFYDYAEYDLYYSDNKLADWTATRISDGVILWLRNYFYDTSGKLYNRIIYLNSYNPQTNQNDLQLSSRNTYSYDKYNLNDTTVNEIWDGIGWKFSSRHVYFRRLEMVDRIYICLKGKTLCINENALEEFLKRGATLGKCEDDCRNPPCKDKPANNVKGSDTSLSLYPNPATEVARLTNFDSSAKSLILVNSSGTVVRNLRILESEEFTIFRQGLPSGVYVFYLCGDNGDIISKGSLIFR